MKRIELGERRRGLVANENTLVATRKLRRRSGDRGFPFCRTRWNWREHSFFGNLEDIAVFKGQFRKAIFDA